MVGLGEHTAGSVWGYGLVPCHTVVGRTWALQLNTGHSLNEWEIKVKVVK